MALITAPVVPVGQKPTPDTWLGPASVPGDWWNNLVICAPLWEGSSVSSGIDELVRREGKQAPVTSYGSSAVSWGHDKYGPYTDHAHSRSYFPLGRNSFSYRLMPSGGAPGPGHDGFSWMVVARRVSAASTFSYMVSDNTDYGDGGTDYHGCSFIWANDNDLQITYGDNTGGVGTDVRAVLTTNNPMQRNEWYVLSGSMTGPTSGQLYVNGAAQPTTTSGSGGGVVYDTGLVAAIGDGVLIDQQRDVQLAVVYGWARELSPTEHLALAVDPFAPIRSYSVLGVIAEAAAPPAATAVRRHLMMMGMGR